MEKQEIIANLEFRLGSLGIPYQKGTGTDFSIATVFLDASWGAGNKKIEYQAAAFLNEGVRTLYFWEFTKETGAGFSCGGGSETSFQSGTTLFRKIKSVGYGPDGKAFEYTLDLGAISKAFKETAKQYGWKFKVVLQRGKASYPPGYMPEVSPCPPQPSSGPASPSFPANDQQQSIPTGYHNDISGPAPLQESNPFQPDQTPQPSASIGQADLSRQKTLPQPGNVAQEQSPHLSGSFYARGKRSAPTGKTGILYWVFLLILVLLDLLLFIGGSGVLFLGLAALVPVLLFVFRKVLAQGFIKPTLCFVGALLITFIIFAVTSNRWYFEGKIDNAGTAMTGEFQAINRDNQYFLKGKWEAHKK